MKISKIGLLGGSCLAGLVLSIGAAQAQLATVSCDNSMTATGSDIVLCSGTNTLDLNLQGFAADPNGLDGVGDIVIQTGDFTGDIQTVFELTVINAEATSLIEDTLQGFVDDTITDAEFLAFNEAFLLTGAGGSAPSPTITGNLFSTPAGSDSSVIIFNDGVIDGGVILSSVGGFSILNSTDGRIDSDISAGAFTSGLSDPAYLINYGQVNGDIVFDEFIAYSTIANIGGGVDLSDAALTQLLGLGRPRELYTPEINKELALLGVPDAERAQFTGSVTGSGQFTLIYNAGLLDSPSITASGTADGVETRVVNSVSGEIGSSSAVLLQATAGAEDLSVWNFGQIENFIFNATGAEDSLIVNAGNDSGLDDLVFDFESEFITESETSAQALERFSGILTRGLAENATPATFELNFIGNDENSEEIFNIGNLSGTITFNGGRKRFLQYPRRCLFWQSIGEWGIKFTGGWMTRNSRQLSILARLLAILLAAMKRITFLISPRRRISMARFREADSIRLEAADDGLINNSSVAVTNELEIPERTAFSGLATDLENGVGSSTKAQWTGTISTGGGNDILYNTGVINGDVDLGANDDSYVANGSVGAVALGAGDDIAHIYTGATFTSLDGGAGDADTVSFFGEGSIDAGLLLGFETIDFGLWSIAGTGDLNGADVTLSLDGLSGVLINIGTLNVNASVGETLTLAGDVTADTTTITQGGLSVNGTLTSDVNVNMNGVLGGDGNIVGDVINSGVVSPGNSPGVLNITGDYNNAGGDYIVEATAAGG